MKDRIVIIGAGGFGLEILGIVRDLGRHEVVGFVDNDPRSWGRSEGTAVVLGGDDRLAPLLAEGVRHAVVAVGVGSARRTISERLEEAGWTLPANIHPRAYVAPGVAVGDGAVVYPGALVMPGCTVGRGVLLNAGATIGHHTWVGDYSNVNPGANVAGRVSIGEAALVGIGAVVLEGRRIGAGAKVGGGAVVTRDVEPGLTVVGAPARPLVKAGA
jgi:UDP-perosamine 4-acetyltransferase